MRVLLADDEERSRKAISFFLRQVLECEVVECENGLAALEEYRRNPAPVVISDIRMPQVDGLTLLREIKNSQEGAKTAVILVTGFADVDSAVIALREGAYDYLHKPVSVDTLAAVFTKLNHELEHPREQPAKIEPLANGISQTLLIPDYGRIGVFSSEMKSIVHLALTLHKDRSIPCLIQGETGTGKEGIARLIHHGLGKEDAPFVSVNCPAIPPSLFESELFGYESGAFTGASAKGVVGRFGEAQGGTLVLDEIGELPMEMQPKLLRVLQERELTRVGGKGSVKLDIRIVTATNRDLQKEMEKGRFREDLYYRLTPGRIDLPPLREQPDQIRHLTQMLMVQLAERKGKSFVHISRDVLDEFLNYEWPGNIRELQNILERATLLHDGHTLLPEHIGSLSNAESAMPEGSGLLSADPLRLPDDGLNLQELEDRIITLALKKNKGNVSKTADYLGLSRGALRNRLKHLK